jgi:predicted TIM-barrel fold metal-dependent hydrolase
MDASSIDMQVLSLSSSGLDKLDASIATSLAQDTNDQLAAAVSAHPDRFAAFATLALHEPAKAALELERCVKQLHFKGLIVSGTLNGLFIDDPRFTPVLESVASLDVPIYVHPGLPPKPVADIYFSGLPAAISFALSMAGWGWHAETGLHCMRLMLSGAFDRFPNLKVIVGHMGDHLPFNIARADRVFSEMSGPNAPFKRRLLDYFRDHFYLTTSGYFDIQPFICARDVIGLDRILFSIDYPYSSNADGRKFLDSLPVTPAELEKISHTNAEQLLS